MTLKEKVGQIAQPFKMFDKKFRKGVWWCRYGVHCHANRHNLSTIRRVKELKGFQRVQLDPHQKTKIYFYLTKEELEIYGEHK